MEFYRTSAQISFGKGAKCTYGSAELGGGEEGGGGGNERRGVEPTILRTRDRDLVSTATDNT